MHEIVEKEQEVENKDSKILKINKKLSDKIVIFIRTNLKI